MTGYVSTIREGDGWRWSIVRTTPHGADVVARGHRLYPVEAACRADAIRISQLLHNATIRQEVDGTWEWTCRYEDGSLAIRSAPFADAASCKHDLAVVRLTVRGAMLPAQVNAAPVEGGRRFAGG